MKTQHTQVVLSEVLSAGSWRIVVRAMKDSSASQPTTKQMIDINGIIIVVKQISNRRVQVTWNEIIESSSTEYLYWVTIGDSVQARQCSGADDVCSIVSELASDGAIVVDIDNRDTGSKARLSAKVWSMSTVSLPKTTVATGASEVTLEWPIVANATLYNVTVLSAGGEGKLRPLESQVLYHSWTPLPLVSVSGASPGDRAVVQACRDQSHCGDAAVQVLAGPALPPAASKADPSVVVVASVCGVLGAALLVGLVLLAANSRRVQGKTNANANAGDSPVDRPIQIPMAHLATQ